MTYFRWSIAFGIIAIAASGLVAIPYIAYSSHWRTFLGRVNEAAPVVEAIYRFRDDSGLWPQKLSELVPDYVSAVPKDWDYRWSGYSDQQPPILQLRGPFHMMLKYTFPAFPAEETEGWLATCEGDPVRIDVVQEVPQSTNREKVDRDARARGILETRIAHEPNVESHALKLLELQSPEN